MTRKWWKQTQRHKVGGVRGGKSVFLMIHGEGGACPKLNRT